MASTPSPSRARWLWLSGLLVAAVAAAVAFHLIRSRAPVPVAAAPAVAQPTPPSDVALPPSTQSDSQIRSALSALTPNEVFHRWLQNDELLDRLTVVATNLAEDASPNHHLSFLRPRQRFTAARSGGEMVMSSRSAARYDAFATAISSLDEQKVATAYRTLHPLLESAYHALGYPGRSFDDVATAALQRIVDAPVRDRVVLRRSGSMWVYADQQLESLGPVEKQFLRMGPRNTRLLQHEARSIASALGFHLRGELEAKAAH